MVGDCFTRAPRALRGQKEGLTKRLRAALPALTGAVIAGVALYVSRDVVPGRRSARDFNTGVAAALGRAGGRLAP
jgi:hypothetical protein